MTYASDLGLMVGSKIKLLRGDNGFKVFRGGDILTLVVDDNSQAPYFSGGGCDKKPLHLASAGWEHYKEPVEFIPNLVWKEMTLEEVKAVQIGDKIRIDGVENEVTYTFNKVTDFGFRTTEVRKYRNTDHDTDIVDCDDVREMKYKFEHIVEETGMNTCLERDREYDVKLTGEEIGFCLALLAKTTGNLGYLPYTKFKKVLSPVLALPNITLTYSYNNDQIICEWLDKVFAVPETEDQRKLRELKEQYESLGKAIDAMEKK